MAIQGMTMTDKMFCRCIQTREPHSNLTYSLSGWILTSLQN